MDALFRQADIGFADFDALLALLQDGPFEDRPWQGWLDAMRLRLGASYVSLLLPPALSDGGWSALFAGRAEPDLTARYTGSLHALDPFVNLPRDRIMAVEELIDEPDWLASAVYQSYLAPLGVRYLIGADLALADGRVCRFRVSRGAADGRFGAAEHALCTLLLPHLRRAVRIHSTVEALETERQLHCGTVERLAVGTLILDGRGKVVAANRVARDILSGDDGLQLIDDELRPQLRRERQALSELIVQAAGGGAEQPGLVAGMTLSRPSGRSPYGVLARPLRPADGLIYGARPVAVLHISDPERQVGASPAVIRALFNLTPAEAGLALLLADGITLEEAAVRLGSSRHTVRSQLRSIFAKTGVTRQTELVRLILRSVAPLG